MTTSAMVASTVLPLLTSCGMAVSTAGIALMLLAVAPERFHNGTYERNCEFTEKKKVRDTPRWPSHPTFWQGISCRALQVATHQAHLLWSLPCCHCRLGLHLEYLHH